VLLGGINGVMSYLTGPTIGEVALLVAAIVLLRLMPRGITGPLLPEVAVMGGWTRENRWRAGLVIAASLFTLIAPQVLQLFTIINLTTIIALAILALSLALVWGYGGILCFGQVAFFGLGAYAYTIAAINFGGSTWAILVAVLVAAAFAALLGYFMFYGRVSDVYLASSP
jgi:hypothetical protein